MSLHTYTFPIPVAYDCTLYRPACVLIAAGMGGNTNFAKEIDTSLWLLAPTENLKVYSIESQDQLEKLIALTEQFHKRKRS